MSKSVPELSLRDFTHGDQASRARFSDALFGGLQDYGFFTLTDHNVDARLLDRAYGLAAEVFALPDEVKRAHAGGLRGYTPFGTEHARDHAQPDLKEFWQIGRDAPAGHENDPDFPPNVWPDSLPAFREVFSALFDSLDQTGRIILRALAPKLDLDEDWFEPRVKNGVSILRVLHYPPLSPDVPEGAVRAAAHEDINFITILVAAKGAGLELLDRDGSWLPVETEPRNLIVDSGDMLARLTNGVIPATTHRVVNPSGPNLSRYSMPFFMHPSNDVSLECLPSCVGEGAKHPPITAGAFLHQRLREIGLIK